MRIARRLTLLSLVALMLVPSAAQASDQSVYDAYVSRDAQFAQLGKDFRSAMASFQRRATSRRAAAVLRVIKSTRAEIDTVRRAILGQPSSSANGKRAGEYALRSLKWFDSSQAAFASAVRAGRARRFRDESTWLRRADARMDAAADNERLARRYFKRAGIQLKPR